MRKIIALLCAAVMIFTQVCASAEMVFSDTVKNPNLTIPIDPETIPVDGTLIVEFEDITEYDESIVGPMSSNGASGGKILAIRAPEHNLTETDNEWMNHMDAIDVSYTANFDAHGTYNVWVRCGNRDSWRYSLNGGESWKTEGSTNTDPQDSNFAWEKLTNIVSRNETAEFKEKGSSMTLLIEHRYKDVDLDKMIITSDLAFIPEGPNPIPDGDTTKHYPIPSFKPIEGHPRLYIAAKDVPRLRENAKEPEMAKFVQNMKDNARWPVNSKQDGSYNATVPVRLMGRCMAYLLGEVDDAHARETIEHCKTYLATAEYNLKAGDITRQVGSEMEAAAVVYDWLYHLLTEDEKQYFVAQLKKLCTWKELAYPAHGNEVYGHSGEKEIFQDMLSVGIAIYDEDPEVFNLAAGMYEKMVPSRKMFNAAGNHPSGHDYGTWRFHCELMSEISLDAMEIPREYRFTEGAWNVPLRWIYSRKPDGDVFREGDDTEGGKYFSYKTARTPAMMAITANLYPDAPLNGLLYGEWLMNESLMDWALLPFYMLLIWDKDNPNEPDLGQDMPLTYYSTYPLTQVYARTSWQKGIDAPTAMAFMDGREKITDIHIAPAQGSFQIYYKGTLANKSTGPRDKGGWITEMDENWNRRTAAHNLVTVKDPDEVFFDNYYCYEKDWQVIANDGGQDYQEFLQVGEVNTYENLLKRKQTATTEGIYVGPNKMTPAFSYVQTDLTKAYAGKRVNKDTGVLLQDDLKFSTEFGSTLSRDVLIPALGFESNPMRDFYNEFNEKYVVVPKVSDNTRSMVFVDLFNDDYPAAFICFDKVNSTNAEFEKNWMLHMLEEPTVEGTTTTVTRKDFGYNGKMVVKTMLPENPDIEVIGGEGKATWVDGRNFGDITDGAQEEGGWRIEVSPSTAAEEDLFLHAMYVTDYDRNLPELPMYKEDNGDYVGVTVMDRVVMFAKNANDATGTFTLNVRDNNNGGDMYVMVADVAPGMWKVTNADKTQIIEVTEEACTLCFRGKPGAYTITKADGATADVIEYPQAEKEKVGDFQIWSSDGLFRYQKSPAKLIDGVPYVPAIDFLPYYGAEVTENADGGITVKVGTLKSATLFPDSNKAIINGKETEIPNQPKIVDGKLYINPIDIQRTINCSITYDEIGLLMKVVILDDIEKMLAATNTPFDNIVTPVEAVSSSDDGNVIAGMLDLNTETRWTSNGTDEWFTLDLGAQYDLDYLLMSFHSGNKRSVIFEIEVSADGENWRQAWGGQSSGTTTDLEQFKLENANGVRHIRANCHGNTVNQYNSITETIVVKK